MKTVGWLLFGAVFFVSCAACVSGCDGRPLTLTDAVIFLAIATLYRSGR